MVEYINDTVPQNCKILDGKRQIVWEPIQLSNAQYNMFVLNRSIKFYINLNIWNLSSDIQKEIINSMRSDEIGRYALCGRLKY